MVGYADATAFFKAFRELTGLTPGEYRRRFGLSGGPQGSPSYRAAPE
jgi:AraC-like DNA-binding protein